MQSVLDAFSVEEVDSVRRIAQGVRVAWKKDYRSNIRFFTIGVSTIGGSDTIPGPTGVQSRWNQYVYSDESSYVLQMNYERGLNMPMGGLVKALADVRLDNTGEADYGYSLLFADASTNKVSSPYTFPTDAFTVSFWLKPTATFAADRQLMFQAGSMEVFRQGTNDLQVYAYLNASADFAGLRRLRIGRNMPFPGTGGSTTPVAPDGLWHHCCYVVYVSSTSHATIEYYEDGVLLKTSVTDYTGDATTPSGNFIIGNDGGSDAYGASYDHFRIYERRFTSTEVAGLYTTGAAGVLPGANWGFDEGSGTTINDTSGNGHNGTRTGATYSLSTNSLQVGHRSGRYTPYYAGGDSELFTAVGLPRRPLIINAGFNVGGADSTIPQFVGVTDKPPKLDTRSRTIDLSAVDFLGFLQNQYVDKNIMFTSERSDTVIASLLSQAGLATSQYELDTGINILKFGLFETGTKMADIIDMIVKAEYGHFYQDEEGVLRFENRQHWSNYPHYNVQRIITTAQVINQVLPAADHIINVVEVKGSPREVLDTQLIWQAGGYAGAGVVVLPPGNTEVWASYNDPIFEVDRPVPNGSVNQTSFFVANTITDGTGTDVTSSVTLKSIDNFAQNSKLVFTNNSATQIYLIVLDIWGRPARKTGDIYYKGTVGASITAYEEQPLLVQNDYIQDPDWARSYAELILQDFAQPENLMELTILAMPELQLGDLISWQGRQWRIYDIATQISPSVGFTQTLKLLKRTILTYFRIGVSTIGSSDRIAP